MKSLVKFFHYMQLYYVQIRLFVQWAFLNVFFRHYQKGLRSDPEHSELKKAYFGLKNLLKKTKSVSMISFCEA